MFKGLSLNAKMMLAPVCLMLVMAIVGGIGYQALQSTTAEFGRLADETIPNIRGASEMFLAYRQVRISARTLALPGITKEQEAQAVAEVKANIEAYEAADKEYTSVPMLDDEKALYEKVSAAWKDFKEVGARVLSLEASGTPEAKQKMLDIFFNDCPAKAKVFREAMTNLLSFHKKNGEIWTAEAREAAKAANRNLIFAMIFGLLAGVVLTIFTLRSVNGLIGSITVVAQELATGAESIATISGSVSEASEKLSSSSAQQAAALQETTSAVEETSAMVNKNAENAQRSATASTSSQQNAEKGKQVVGDMIQSIEQISASNQAIMQQIEESNKEMSAIVNVINEIGNKTKVINDIVFQTKLLSFNASVEAARAGEHGKGFAVVAEEVGNLAAMSGRSAKEITDLLDTSTKRVQDIVANTQQKVEGLIAQGAERLKTGISTAKNCDVVLGDIVTNVESVSTMVTEIAAASKDQSKGISEINKAINELESAAQQNSATSHSAASSAEELLQQVHKLRNSVGSLNALVKGGEATGLAATSTPAQVIKFPAKAAPVAHAAPKKKAVGSDYTPSANDPGFTEV